MIKNLVWCTEQHYALSIYYFDRNTLTIDRKIAHSTHINRSNPNKYFEVKINVSFSFLWSAKDFKERFFNV